MNSFVETINAGIKEAMKSGDKLRLETLRSLRAGILEFEKSGAGREIGEADIQKILLTAVKKRKDAAEQYDNVGRTELADKERAELTIIQEFLPKQMTEDEIRVRLQEIISEVGAQSAQDFGKVMGTATKEMRGKADGSTIQRIAKELLS